MSTGPSKFRRFHFRCTSMSHVLPADNDFTSQEPPVYTEAAPLIWIDLSIQGRYFKNLPWSGYVYEAIPISPQLYAALHKVSCLVASRLAEPDDQQGLSDPSVKWDRLSSLLLYVTSFLFKINHGINIFLSPTLADAHFRLDYEGSGGYPQFMHS
jgi:hypothetical protein